MGGATKLFVGVVALLFALPVLVVTMLGENEGAGVPLCGDATGVGEVLPSGHTMTNEMLTNARTIIMVGIDMEVPDQAHLVALMTTMVESALVNVDHGDADSLGLFQQRPSQGWGTAEEVMDPEVSARAFYAALLEIEGWEEMGLGNAAQAVQRSAYPFRYAGHLADAIAIIALIQEAGAEEWCSSDGELADVEAPAGGTITVAASIAPNLAGLLAAAEADGVILGGWGHRTTERQIELREQNCGSSDYAIYEMPSSQCSPPTARPGSSMHETGQAVDFTCNGTTQTVQRGDACDSWLMANAEDFDLFNLPSEAWHYSTTGN